MDDQSFDRIARLLGGTATRRGGILAAAAAALGLSAGASLADAAEGDVDAEKKGRCKPSAKGASAGTESAVDAEKGKKKTRCRKNSECCSLICTGKRRRKKHKKHHNKHHNKHNHKHHNHNNKDAAVNGLMASQDDLDEAGFDEAGYEDSSAGDADLRGLAAASDVETEKHRRRGRNRRRCRCRRAGATCNVDVNCCNGRACVDGKCTGKSKNVPTGESCDAGNDTCRNRAAICTQYADKQPGGTYCLIPDGKACSGNSQCVSESCQNGICAGAGVPTSKVCTVGGTPCANPAATCTAYTAPANPRGNFCLLADGQACTANDDCVGAYCNAGVCSPCTLLANGKACTADAECCSGICIITNGEGVCIGARTIWTVNAWTKADYDVDTHVWLPQSVPTDDELDDAAYTAGGDAVWYQNEKYPYSWTESDATPVPDVILDVDDTGAPGFERILFWNPVPGGTYRYILHMYDYCSGDSYATNACGTSWSNWEGPGLPNNNTDPQFISPNFDNTVTFYEGRDTVVGKFYLPNTVGQGVTDPNHVYYWHVVDVTFNQDGFFQTFSYPNGSMGGPLLDCHPQPYARNPNYAGGDYSNQCIVPIA